MEPRRKKKLLLSNMYTGCLIGIRVKVYHNPHITGQYFIPHITFYAKELWKTIAHLRCKFKAFWPTNLAFQQDSENSVGDPVLGS